MRTAAVGAPDPSWWLRVRSSVLDRIVALALVPVVAPAVAAVALRAVRAEGRPVFVGLERVGRGGRVFRMWKVRTMGANEADGSAGGAVITAGDDGRVTPIGRTLRRRRLDELPQILNVLRGDMALFGPRPETPALVELSDPRWSAVLAVRPGIAGATQFLVDQWEDSVLEDGAQEHRYASVVLPVKLAADQWYVEHASLLLDLRLAWSMAERFVLGRAVTSVERSVRAEVAEASTVPLREILGTDPGARAGARPVRH